MSCRRNGNHYRIRERLRKHYERTQELIRSGMTAETASRQAYEEITHAKKNKKTVDFSNEK